MEQNTVQEITLPKKENTGISEAESDQQPCGNVLRRHERANPMTLKLAQHRVWMESMPHEYPMPYNHYRIGVYIRYYNQTKHKNYLEKHMQQFMDDISLCPNWTLVDFYVDHGMNAPRMENAKEWCRLLEDCVAGKIDLIVTQKVSNVSNDPQEMTLVARMLASLSRPVGIYFISEDIYTGASYYTPEYREQGWLPPGWKVLPPDELDEPLQLENVQPAHEISAAEAVGGQKTGQG